MKDHLIKFILNLERGLKAVCLGFAWSTLLLLLAILLQVILRLFGQATIKLTELQWHFYAIVIMVSLAYAQLERTHVGVDLIFERLSSKWQKRIETGAIILFLIPLYSYITWQSFDFVESAYRLKEHSPNPGGLPWRFIIKSFIPIGSILLILSAIVRAGTILLFTGDNEKPDHNSSLNTRTGSSRLN